MSKGMTTALMIIALNRALVWISVVSVSAFREIAAAA